MVRKALWMVTLVLALLMNSSAALANGDSIAVTHALGKVEVTQDPQTVVVFDYGILDTLDNFGVEVAGVVKSTLPEYLAKYRENEYVDVGTLFEPNFERIYELQPDVILISDRQAEVFDELNRIAPTVYLSIDSSNYFESFSHNLRVLGDIFRKSDFVEDELDALSAQMQEVSDKATAGGLDALVIMANDGALSAYGPGSRFGIVHKEFGFPAADPKIEVVNHGQNVSFEYLVQINPDLLFVIDRAATVGGSVSARQVLDNALVKMTDAHKNDRIIYLNSQVWYVAAGGLTATQIMLEDVANVFSN